MLTLWTVAACAGSAPKLEVTTSAFASGATIPVQYTCDGVDESPVLSWGEAPAGTQSLAVIVDDPDAPSKVWVHFLAWGIAPTERGLPANVVAGQPGFVQGTTDFGKAQWNGPCPPPGTPHHYFFRVYALDAALTLPSSTKRPALDTAMNGHILAYGEVVGTYGRAATK